MQCGLWNCIGQNPGNHGSLEVAGRVLAMQPLLHKNLAVVRNQPAAARIPLNFQSQEHAVQTLIQPDVQRNAVITQEAALPQILQWRPAGSCDQQDRAAATASAGSDQSAADSGSAKSGDAGV